MSIPVIKVKNESGFKLESAYDNATCFDLKASLSKYGHLLIASGETKVVSTNLFFDLPEGYGMEIRSRSSMAKKGIIVTNSPGTVDNDYTGEVKVLLTNLTSKSYVVQNGDKIAQAKLEKIIPFVFEEVETIDKQTKRGSKGFGSSGK